MRNHQDPINRCLLRIDIQQLKLLPEQHGSVVHICTTLSRGKPVPKPANLALLLAVLHKVTVLDVAKLLLRQCRIDLRSDDVVFKRPAESSHGLKRPEEGRHEDHERLVTHYRLQAMTKIFSLLYACRGERNEVVSLLLIRRLVHVALGLAMPQEEDVLRQELAPPFLNLSRQAAQVSPEPAAAAIFCGIATAPVHVPAGPPCDARCDKGTDKATPCKG
mmetsp:Transcript_51794/g.123258  ORF Transcript_51794/g.123258 Transcript_51794/m.123258 type:complete len:219 (+) Transcript_51794:694-1350(+)